MDKNSTFSATLGSIGTTLILGTIIGALASLASIGFIELIFILNDWLKVSAKSRALTTNPVVLTSATLLVPSLGGLVVGWLIWRLTREKRPQSVADIISESLSHSHDQSLWNRFVNILASLISLGCGASVGQYGPVAYLGGSIGTAIAKTTGNRFYHDNIALCCGVAAAISTVFNAPITGVVFVHEVILRHYSLRAFAPVTVASTVGFVIANQFFDKLPLFSIGIVNTASAQEFVLFGLIGLCGAIVAQLFMQSILYFGRLSQTLNVHQVFKPMMAGFAVGVAALWLPDVMGVGKEAIRLATIDGAFTSVELSTLLVMKILLTGLCLGFGFAGGVFSPAVFTGIMFGTLCGIIANQIPGIERSELVFYTICGMVAVTSPVIGAPLTTIIIVLELTRNYSITTAAMVSVVLSNIVAYRLFGRSLFDKVLLNRGVDLGLGRDKAVLNIKQIKPYISDDFCPITADTTLGQARRSMIKADATEAYLLDENSILSGSISLVKLAALIDKGEDMEQSVITHVDQNGFYLLQENTIWEAMNGIENFVGESIPVLEDNESKRMLGIVHESTIIKAYLDTTSTLRQEENL